MDEAMKKEQVPDSPASRTYVEAERDRLWERPHPQTDGRFLSGIAESKEIPS